MPEATREIRICHLYPDILNLYGDRGNVLALRRRLEWRGIAARVTGCPLGEPLDPGGYDLFFIGGGQDFEQALILRDLEGGKDSAIREAVEAGKTFLAVCGGYQLLGKYYETHGGARLDFIGAIDAWTVGERERLIGNTLYELGEDNGGGKAVAFENHSGRTWLGEGVSPLGRVVTGGGNNGVDGTEGARYKNVFCTYGHGPILPKNPGLCDAILKTAIPERFGGMDFPELDDSCEAAARHAIIARL